jgi:hypothetical protein
MPLHFGHEPRKEIQLRRCDGSVIDHRSKRIATVDRVDCCQFACVLAYDLSNLPQHGSPFEWMNVSPKPKPSLSGRHDRRNIRHVTIGDFTEALTSAGTLDSDAVPGFRFVPSTVIVQFSIRR